MAFYMRSPVYTPNDPVKSVKQLHSWLYQLNENLKFMFSNLDSDNFTTEFSACFSEEAARKTQEEIQKLDETVGALGGKGTWEEIELNNFSAMNDLTAPAVMNLFGLVCVTGEAQIIDALPGGTARRLTMLKQKYRPQKKQEFVCRSGGIFLTAIVREDGEISVFNPSGEALPQNSTVVFSFSYAL